MTIDRKLLEILVCPVTKQSVSVISETRLESLNQAIKKGGIVNHAGDSVTEPLQLALVATNGSIYPIVDGIPVMLEDASIDAEQLDDS